MGAPFAVLVAEELFASGCRLLLSLTSAGQIVAAGPPPYFVIIDRALRDEGTSYHYAAAAEFAHADPRLVAMARDALAAKRLHAVVGASWTTDAPFRETAAAIDGARAKGVLAVEMEAAALYAFAGAAGVAVLCLAHVTNTMGQAATGFREGRRRRHRRCLGGAGGDFRAVVPTLSRSCRLGEPKSAIEINARLCPERRSAVRGNRRGLPRRPR